MFIKFQFHKVRLKAMKELIKIGVKMFQFHKVRLKEILRRTAIQSIKFQFHKVRLKAWNQTKPNQCY